MELKPVAYHPRYATDCVNLMSDTWNFDPLFPGLTDPGLVNRFFFQEAISGATYSEVIVDEQDRVHGYIFGTVRSGPMDHARAALGSATLGLRALWDWALGRLGPRREAWRRMRGLLDMTARLEAHRQPEDGYVNLFLVGSSLRGMGWGRRLMERLEDSCREAGLRRLYLWTDTGCNYGFYDHTGFSRTIELSSPYLTNPGPEPNGFAYVKALG